MLITDLAATEAVQVVEREKLNEVLQELKLSSSRFIDAKTSQKLGRGLAAEYILTGSFQVMNGVLRIDARLLKVSTGKVLVTTKTEGPTDEFFALEKELVETLVDKLSLRLTPKAKVALRRNATQLYTAWVSYSAGLAAVDERDEAAARRAFEAALRADPSYQAARSASERLSRIFQRHDETVLENARLTSSELSAADLPERIDALLAGLDNTKTTQFQKKLEVLQKLADAKKLACRQRGGPALGNPTVLNGGVPAGGVISHCPQVQEVMRVAYRLVEDPDAWGQLPKVCEYFIAQLPGDLALLRYCETTIMASLQEKQREGADVAKAAFEEERTEALGYSLNDWRHALAENHSAMRRLIQSYAGAR